MKRLVVCVYWHNAPWDPAEYFPVADKVSARLAEIGGRRLTWGADRYAFDFEPEQFDDVVQVVMRVLTELPGHSVGLALRGLAFRQANSGSLRACGLALALAEALAVAAGAGEALVDPEIDYQNSGLRKIGVIDVERFDLSLRAATLIPGPSSIQGFFDVPLLPRPSRAPGLDATTEGHAGTPSPSAVARGPVSKPPLRTATPSRLPPREGSPTATPRPASVRPSIGVRVPHPPRPGHSPPVLVRPSAAPPPLKRPSFAPLSSIASARASETPLPPTSPASLDTEETMQPPSVVGVKATKAVATASLRPEAPEPARSNESGEIAVVSAPQSAGSGERPSVNPSRRSESPASEPGSMPSSVNANSPSAAKAPRPSDSGEMRSVRPLPPRPSTLRPSASGGAGADAIGETPPPASARAGSSSQEGTLPPPAVRPLPPRPSPNSAMGERAIGERASGEMPSVASSASSREESSPDSADDLVEELQEVETLEVGPRRSAPPPPPSRRTESVRTVTSAADEGKETPATQAANATFDEQGEADTDDDEALAAAASSGNVASTSAEGAPNNKKRKRRRRRKKGGQVGESPS